jgi:hypothetical protein
LKQQFGGQLSAKALREVRRPLVVSNERERHDKRKALREVTSKLRVGRRRIEKWDWGKGGFRDLSDGLRLTFRQGRGRMCARE